MNVLKMCWKSPTQALILISCWLPHPLVWKMLGAGVEYEYLFHLESPWHIWRAVDVTSWHLCWGSYLLYSQEGTARQSYGLHRGLGVRLVSHALWISNLWLSQGAIWQPVSCCCGPRPKQENSLATVLSNGCWFAVPQPSTPPKLTCLWSCP